MAKLKINAGTTSKTVRLFIQNASSSGGLGLLGLTSGSSGLAAYYLREGAAGPATAIGLTAGTVGTWSSGGFVAADVTNLPGVYELGLPNAALATGAQSVVVMLFGAISMVPVILEIELDAVNYQSNTGFVASVPAVVGAVGSVSNPATIAASILLTPAHLLAVDANNEVTANNGINGPVAANITEINGSTFSGANIPAIVEAMATGVQAPVGFLAADSTGIAAIVEAIMAHSVETGVSVVQVLEALLAYAAGNTDGNSTFYAGNNPATQRITFTENPTTGARAVTLHL